MVTKNESKKSNNSLLEEGKYSAVDIARLLLSYDPKREYFKDEKMSLKTDETNPTIGNFRLNKMLHICYMLYYSKYGRPLFRESLRAYPRGALVYKILMNFFQLFREKLKTQEIPAEEEDERFINKAYCYFKNNSDQELEDFSHSDITWKERRRKIMKEDEDDDRMITDEKAKGFYRNVLRHIVKEAGLN